MTETQTLRKLLKKQIDTANDKSLRMVQAILEIENTPESSLEGEWDIEVSPEEITAIKKSLNSVKNKATIPHAEAIHQLTWFPK
ncbi:MAG: hypothetical protein EBZ77_16215 [Chitinophagia bacterium]|nr:hypothetical protein [Chitinophagia bacterium]